jgi:hypothetical protein
MKDCWSSLVEGIDYVECKLCKYVAILLSRHVKNIHNITSKEYKNAYGLLTESCKLILKDVILNLTTEPRLTIIGSKHEDRR